jgi:putative flippase GtrA
MEPFILPELPQLEMLKQFLRFGVVGAMGFVVDTTTVYLLLGSVGVYAAGLIAYPVAASFNWAANRLWTFRGLSTGSVSAQWGKFLVVNLLGFLLNRGTYVVLVSISPFIAQHPVFAVAAGAVAGLAVNFDLSRRHVFR